MPEQEPTLRELIGRMEDLQKQAKARLDALDPAKPTLTAKELIATSNRLVVLSRVFLDLAIAVNK